MATGYTVSGGSTSVVVGMQTATFLVSATGGDFTAGDILTISSSTGAVTISLGTVDNNGSDSAVGHVEEDLPSFTFHVTWATTGTKSIVYTNSQAWINPSNGSVEVTAKAANNRMSLSLGKIGL